MRRPPFGMSIAVDYSVLDVTQSPQKNRWVSPVGLLHVLQIATLTNYNF